MKSFIIAGVGGQGTLLAGNILSRYALNKGLDVKLSEVHGMAQRGGSVVTYVRIGDDGEKVFSPLIDKGEADVLIAFELLEGLRWLTHVKNESGKAYINNQKILPMPVITGTEQYPEDIERQINNILPNTIFIDGVKLANEIGNPKVVNTILLGAVAYDLDPDIGLWEKVIAETVKPKFIELNKSAFKKGFEAAKIL